MATPESSRPCAHCSAPLIKPSQRCFCSRRCASRHHIRPRAAVANRFWAKVQMGDPLECWRWTGANDGRYGHFRVWRDGVMRTERSHRVAWELTHGPIPPGMDVLHRCDRPICVNPACLFLGTHTDNMRDCVSKGRLTRAKGQFHHNAKLTDAAVDEFRARYAAGGITQRQLAAKYGVTLSGIQKVLYGQSWKHSLPASRLERTAAKAAITDRLAEVWDEAAHSIPEALAQTRTQENPPHGPTSERVLRHAYGAKR